MECNIIEVYDMVKSYNYVFSIVNKSELDELFSKTWVSNPAHK
jgi:hypothetical protein